MGRHYPAFTLAAHVHALSDDLPPADFWDEPGVPSVYALVETVPVAMADEAGTVRFAGVS